MAMKILVTGANGFVGSHLCEMLAQQGHQVVRAVRSRQSGDGDDVVETGEISSTTDWRAALEGVEVVVHSAARVHVLNESINEPMSEFREINVHGTVRLAEQAAAAGVKRLVFISTIGVLGNYSESPLHEHYHPHPSNGYSRSKREAEAKLMQLPPECGIEITIIRPPLVYGPGVKANFLKLMRCIDAARPLPFGMVPNARDYVSIANLCHFIERCLWHEAAANQVFLVADGEPISTPELIRRLARLMGRPVRLLPVPRWVLRVGARLLRKERLYHSICSSLRIDTSKAQLYLDWQPVESLQQGLEQTVAWYRSS